jgi:predicted nucleic acid-binding protein
MNGAGPLVDTSVLIDYFSGIDSRETNILDKLLDQGPPPATAPIIMQEYLQGLTNPHEFALAQADLENFRQLPPPDYEIHLQAAEAHVRMKRRGTTVPTIDTLIVAIAQAAGCSLLTRDGRQREFARFLKVRLA